MKTFALALGMLWLAPLAFGDAAESVSVGGLVVRVPSDWAQKRTDVGLVLKPAAMAARDDCAFTLLGGEAFSGKVKDRLNEEWAGFEKLGTMKFDDKGKVDGEGKAVEVANRSGTIALKNGGEISVWLLVVKANDRIERMVFVAATQDLFAKYAPTVGAMINGFRYVPPKAAEELSGVCFGIVHVKTDVRAEQWIFLPKGVVYHGFPAGGAAHMDLELMRKWRPQSFGEYRVEGKDVVVTMGKEKTAMRLVVSDGAWAATVTREFQDRYQTSPGFFQYWTDQVETQLRIAKLPSCDGMKLNGSYRMVPDGRRHTLKTAKPTSTLTFMEDGSFIDEGVVCEMDPGEMDASKGTMKASAAPPVGGRGTYSIAKNTVDFKFDNGAKVSMSFLAGKWDLEKGALEGFYLDMLPVVRQQ